MTYKKFTFLFALLILTACNVNNTENKGYEPRTITYYIAAENVEWDYAPEKHNLNHEELEEGMSDEEKEGHLKHAINGYMYSSLTS